MNQLVLSIDRLSSTSLLRLNSKDVLVVRVADFFNQRVCMTVADRIETSELFGNYANAPAIGRVGQAFFECLASDELRQVYERHALQWIREMRQFCEPFLTPIDKLRLALDELWPGGSQLATLDGQKMFVGLARIFGQGSAAEPHQDVLAWDAPDAPEARRLLRQFAANIYLRVPKTGGELKIWPQSLNWDQYQKNRNPDSYGIDPSTLKGDPIVIRPKLGELILFDSTMIHAVEASSVGPRVTWSCFLGSTGTQSPLTMWS